MTMPYAFDNNLPGSPSAIGALLQQLVARNTPPQAPQGGPGGPGPVNIGGITAPAPQSPPMPTVQAPPAPQNMMGRIHDFLQGATQGDVPPGYEGLLTPDEIKKARPGLLSSIIGGPDARSGETRFKENLNQILGMKALAQQMAEQARVRNAIAAMPKLPANANPDQFRAWAQDAYAHAVENNLPEDIKSKFADIVKESIKAPKADPTKVVGAGGALVDANGKPLYTAPAMAKEYEPKPFTLNGETIWVKPGDAVPKGAKPLQQAMGELRIETQSSRADTARQDALSKRFESSIKPLRDRAAIIEQAITTVDRAKNSPDPNERHALYTSALANFVQAADQKAQIRYQLLNYFKQNIDPSIGGRWDILVNRVASGKLPDRIMEGMLTHLTNLRDLTKKEIDAQRDGYVKRYKSVGLDDVLPSSDDYFPSMGAMSAPPSGGGSDLYSKYGLTPKKP